MFTKNFILELLAVLVGILLVTLNIKVFLVYLLVVIIGLIDARTERILQSVKEEIKNRKYVKSKEEEIKEVQEYVNSM